MSGSKKEIFRFKALLLDDGWLENAVVEVDEKGRITSVAEDRAVKGSGFALPGFQNAHSHAFQYAMAGLAEERGTGGGVARDFWSWRGVMYRLASKIGPDEMEGVAAMLYAELVRHGYTSVAEFHYLHNDPSGRPYTDPAEMGSRLVAAAQNAGINITLVPVLYQRAGFGRKAESGQHRFLSHSVADYCRLVEATKAVCANWRHAAPGLGAHSIRAVRPETIIEAAELDTEIPFHIHIAEQPGEVDECVSALGKRPLEWVLGEVELSDRFNLVHATHVNGREVEGVAKSGANVVLCPSTEGNLGDGIFPLGKFIGAGGVWSIGTDSHVGLNPFGEIRILDYGQRLSTHDRNSFGVRGEAFPGLSAVTSGAVSGRLAMGDRSNEFFEVGRPFNAFVLSDAHPFLSSTKPESLLGRIVYSSDTTMAEGTIVNGRWVVRRGVHERIDRISSEYRKAVRSLSDI